MDLSEAFLIGISTLDDVCVVTLRGDWDLSNKDRLHDAFASLGTKQDVLIDLRESSFFDSSALGELIGLYKKLNAHGRRLEALVGNSNMQRLLELTSLSDLLGISPERAQYFIERLPPPPGDDLILEG